MKSTVNASKLKNKIVRKHAHGQKCHFLFIYFTLIRVLYVYIFRERKMWRIWKRQTACENGGALNYFLGNRRIAVVKKKHAPLHLNWESIHRFGVEWKTWSGFNRSAWNWVEIWLNCSPLKRSSFVSIINCNFQNCHMIKAPNCYAVLEELSIGN